MNDDVAIKVENVSKNFKLPHEKTTSIKSAVISFYKRKKTYEKQKVLNDISFDVKKGEFFGIVGRNGSGKSTLLKILAGTYLPTSGAIKVNGKLTPFIELGVGFNPELTGRENVYLNGALLGFNRTDMDVMYEDIVKFAELERFMDQKLKNYSSGMQVRLAFSIAIRADSDILLLDEVLAVGDAIFQKKCYDYFKQLKKNKKTVVFVSHDSAALMEYCDRGILIEEGHIISEGKIDTVVHDYIDSLNKEEGEQLDNDEEAKRDKRWGTGQMTVGRVTVNKLGGKPNRVFSDDDRDIQIEVEFKSNEFLEKPILGITISDPSGLVVFQSNTLWTNHKTEDIDVGEIARVKWVIPNVFNTGTFYVSPAASDASGATTYDWLEDAESFRVRKKQKSHGSINAQHDLITQYERN